jgi:hypothetical protein
MQQQQPLQGQTPATFVMHAPSATAASSSSSVNYCDIGIVSTSDIFVGNIGTWIT